MERNVLHDQALGILETKSLIAALEAADAMLKTAKVSLAGQQRTGRARVTIMVTGSLDAVEAAISAGAERARRLSGSVTTHILPRPHGDLECILQDPGKKRAGLQ